MSAKLAKKLAEVMAAVSRIPKRGRNDFHKYDYATEADIAEAIRAELAQRHVILIPAITDQSRESVGEKGSVLTTLRMEFTFYDGESGDTITRPWIGAGTDKEDKGVYKAMTGGEKYFLLKTFLLPTGDDPEADDKKKAAAKPSVEVKAPAVHQHQAPEGANRLQKVWQDETSAGKIFFHVVTDEGEELMTWSESVGKAAEQACQDGLPVRLQIRGKYEDMGVIKSLTVALPPVAQDALETIAQVFNKTVPPAERAF